MERRIQFATTSDGVRVAFQVIGDGPPLVLTPGWVSHLELDWQSPTVVPLLDRLAQRSRVIRYDGRGTGLSDRHVEDLSYHGRVRDIAAVADHLDLDSFTLWGMSQDGPPAIAYAAENPERVKRLILYATFARPFGVTREALTKALIALIRAEWEVGSRTVVEFVFPEADHE